MSVTLATRNRGRVVELSYVFLDVCVWAKLSKLEDGGLGGLLWRRGAH